MALLSVEVEEGGLYSGSRTPQICSTGSIAAKPRQVVWQAGQGRGVATPEAPHTA